ncbi:unnamed protein product [Rotaria magnacalcarata]|uniref:NmrA-like domain-containing protein n=1 Tax=Rotaria magnacalcarata TaxID=392030 RepID=A0A820EWU0_9BILA|nr:unnamed protein product [Rotaria magnacalcarata]CAF2132299.1 unnamed protein product [Rotaria magnacalcarata]CAF4138165.1 unnamed protein product [Rotaria magnacalcarata]CAF4255226.1 unnamed protein product [Rotaria magnacalcarata]
MYLLALLDACVEAGVQRFAPSVWYGKHSKSTLCAVHQKLRLPIIDAVQKSGIEYTIFMVGHLLDYFAAPQKSTSYLQTFPIIVDINKCTAAFVGTGDEPFCVTAIDDVGQYVAAALDLKTWEPEMGISGSRTCWNDVIRLGEKLRCRKFEVKRMTPEECLATRVPNPPTTRTNQLQEWLISYYCDEIDYEPTLNNKFPHLKATTLEEFMNKWWAGKESQTF